MPSPVCQDLYTTCGRSGTRAARPEFFPPHTHLLADSAYTLQENVMVRYRDRGQLTVEQAYHNRVLSAVRSSVERAIGLLKCKWRILLGKLPMKRLDLAPFYIIACCVLHNVGLMSDDEMALPVVNPDNDVDNLPLFPTNQQRLIGAAKRREITNILND